MTDEPTACELNGEATVAERWSWVQTNLPAIGKGRTNQQQNFKYRGIDDVLDKLKPLFGKAGVFVLPARQKAEYAERVTAKGTVMHVCKIVCTWQIYGVKGDWITAETAGEAADTFDKATSKAQTAAFKYLLWPALAIAENEDSDAETPEVTVRAQQPALDLGAKVADMAARGVGVPGPDEITTPQINKIRIQLRDLGMSEGTDLVNAFKRACPEDEWPDLGLHGMSKRQGSALIDTLQG